MTTKKILVVDPPSGWLYGFPKPCPVEAMNDKEFGEWLMQQGYPPSLVPLALRHSRYWESSLPESQCAAHTEAVGDGQVGEGRKTEETVHEEHNVSSKENEGQKGIS